MNQEYSGEKPKRRGGMRTFTLVWLGQFVSLLGTGMTRFAITLWAWELTGQATALALVAFFAFGPMILISPIAGALVDRWNRKLVMMLSDIGAALASLMLLFLSLTGNLEIWHVYLAAALAGSFEAFQFPAYSAAITLMVDRSQYARTSAMIGLAESASAIIAPIVAVTLYGLLRLEGILLIDVLTAGFAVLMLFVVFIPQPEVSEEGAASKGSLWSDSLFGFRYILRRPSLLALQLVFFVGNFLTSMVFTLIAALVLARTGNNELVLASVSSALGLGGVVGGIAMSTWGGFGRRINGVLGGWLLSSLCGTLVLGLGQTQIVWMLGAFMSTMAIPLINASNQAIWLAKVAPDLQGRVFAVRRLIAGVVAPLAMLIGGPLADFVLEPGMQPGASLAQVFGGLVGVGPGAGLGLMFVLAGIMCAGVAIGAYFMPIVRNVESIIPDYVALPKPPPEPETALQGL